MQVLFDIKEWGGLFTNGDPEDAPEGALTDCQNMRSRNGRLIKTFGLGVKIDSAMAANVDSIYTYIHDQLSGDKLYIGVYVNNSTYVATVYAWNGSNWVGINSISGITFAGTYYHADAKNPIIQESGILRFLPGNTGEPDGSHEAKGIWLGYIDRDFFDGNYLAADTGAVASAATAGGGTQTAFTSNGHGMSAGEVVINSGFTITAYNGTFTIDSVTTNTYTVTVAFDADDTGTWTVDRDRFYNYDIEPIVDTAFFTSTTAVGFRKTELPNYTSSTFPAEDIYYYRFSFVYDGVQESPLSKASMRWEVSAASKFLMIRFDGRTISTFNKRITAMKVYRSSNIDRDFKHIHTIDFLRKSTEIKTNSSGGYNGKYAAYIPALSVYNFDGGQTYKLSIDGASYINIDNPGAGTGNDTVVFTSDTVNSDKWDENWILRRRDDVDGDLASGTDGCYAGTYCFIIDESVDESAYVGGVIYMGHYRVIDQSVAKAVHYEDEYTTERKDSVWWLMSVQDGLYYSTRVGTVINYFFFDTGDLSEGAYHPLAGDLTRGVKNPIEGFNSIKINGKYAIINGNRLMQTDIILDPGGANEAHDDWLSYSEPGQFDVNPVSNVMYIEDREGGPTMGLASVFGNTVILKRKSIITLFHKNYPDNPESWQMQESAHNIGCISEYGYCVVKDSLYVCSYDGIYKLKPNNLAESDQTPTEILRISEPINDIYLALTVEQKQSIRLEYDQQTSELILVQYMSQTLTGSADGGGGTTIDFTSVGHGLKAGDAIILADCANGDYDGAHTVNSVTDDTFNVTESWGGAGGHVSGSFYYYG